MGDVAEGVARWALGLFSSLAFFAYQVEQTRNSPSPVEVMPPSTPNGGDPACRVMHSGGTLSLPARTSVRCAMPMMHPPRDKSSLLPPPATLALSGRAEEEGVKLRAACLAQAGDGVLG